MELSLEQDLNSMEKTAYHEALHLMARWVLPTAEYNRLMKFYKGNEEDAADAFAAYMYNRRIQARRPVGLVRRTFAKLKALLQKLGNALRGRGFARPEDIFEGLRTRKYEGATPRGGDQTSIAMKAEERAQRWYSQMVGHLRDKLPGSGTPEQMIKTLDAWANKGLIKQEELEWSGLREWLAGEKKIHYNPEDDTVMVTQETKQKVTKQEILDYLAENHVQIKEVEKSGEAQDPYGDDDFGDVTVEEDYGEGTVYVSFNEGLADSPRWTNFIDYDPDELLNDHPNALDEKGLEELRNWQAENEAYHEYQTGGEATGSTQQVKDIPLPIKEFFWADTPGGRYEVRTAYDPAGTDYILTRDGEEIGTYTEMDAAAEAASDDLLERWTPPTGGETLFGQWQMEGEKEDYRELLLTLPETRGQKQFDPSKVEIRRNRRSTTQGSTAVYYDGKLLANYGDDPQMTPDGGFEQKSDDYWMGIAKEVFEKGDSRNSINAKSGAFTAGHYDEPNVLAHVRFNTRYLPGEVRPMEVRKTEGARPYKVFVQGYDRHASSWKTRAEAEAVIEKTHGRAPRQKVLFLEEIQSDWHQKGRKEGYKNRDAYQLKDFSIEYNELEGKRIQAVLTNSDGDIWTGTGVTESHANGLALERANRDLLNAVPDAPYKKDLARAGAQAHGALRRRERVRLDCLDAGGGAG